MVSGQGSDGRDSSVFQLGKRQIQWRKLTRWMGLLTPFPKEELCMCESVHLCLGCNSWIVFKIPFLGKIGIFLSTYLLLIATVMALGDFLVHMREYFCFKYYKKISSRG